MKRSLTRDQEEDISNKFKYSSRNDLTQILNALQVPFDLNADNAELGRLISAKLQQKQMKTRETPLETKVNTFLSVIFIMCMAACIILLILSFIIKYQRRIYFCDTDNNSTKCDLCPHRAICTNGKATCDVGYKLMKRFCVQLNESETMIPSCLEYSYKALLNRAGDFKCNYCHKDWISADDLEISLIKKFNRKSHIITDIFPKIIEYISKDNRIIKKDVDGIIVYASIEFRTSIPCRMELFCTRNVRKFVIFTFLTMGFVALVVIQRITNERNKYVKYYAYLLLDFIKIHRNEVTENQIYERFVKMTNSQNLKMWKSVIQLVGKSPSIVKINHGTEFSYKYIA